VTLAHAPGRSFAGGEAGLGSPPAPWHVSLTLVTVYGLDPEEPVLVEVGLL
jgi:hypothetical protein